jgi:hypothetical protein
LYQRDLSMFRPTGCQLKERKGGGIERGQQGYS